MKQPLTHRLPKLAQEKQVRAMTHYTHRIRAHWERYAPNHMKTLAASSEELETLFSEIGTEVLGEVSSLSEDMARVMLAEMPEAREDYLTQVALLTTARKIAEEIAMTHQLAWMSDPSLTLTEARQEWEDTRPMDEGLMMIVDRIQDSPYPIYATEELEETAKLFLLLRNTPVRALDAAQIDELRRVFKLDF